VAHVVVDTDREMVLGPLVLQFVKDGLDHRRGELLRAEPVTTADNARHCAKPTRTVADVFAERRHNVKVHRLACGARLFCAVENGNCRDTRRQALHEALAVKRPVKPDDQDANLLAHGW
jgi:hypothetical protein